MKRKEEVADARSEVSALDLLERAESVRVLHPAQDVLDSVLWYCLPVDGALVAITSARQAHRGDQLPEEIALRHADPGPSTVSRELAVRWLTIGESGSIARTLDAGPPRWCAVVGGDAMVHPRRQPSGRTRPK